MNSKFKIVGLGKLRGTSMEIEERELSKLNIEAEIVAGRFTATEDEFIAQYKDADIILGGGRLFTRRVIESLPKCRAIITYSVGFDGIDVDAATDNGILVVNNPASEWCIEEVSNHAVTLLLICAKKLTQLNSLTKKGSWMESRGLTTSMASIHGQILGLVGCGAIARMAAKKAQCFGLKVIGYDPYLDNSFTRQFGISLMGLPELLKESDFVSVHAPLSKETEHLIGEEEFKLMKPTTYLINTARGNVIDEAALIKALQEKRIAGAGLDVFEKEPINPDNPLLKMDNVTVSPHSASFSDASLDLQPVNPTHEAARVLSGKWPKNVINRTVKPKIELTKE